MRNILSKLKYYAAMLFFAIATSVSSVSPVLAANDKSNDLSDTAPKKVYVCKYVGTPGNNETLQTGQNPINVSVNAIGQDPVVVGSYFNDAQGRSFVLAFDEGQAEPDVSQCPSGQGPNVVQVPAAATVTDPCGVENATWVQPADSATVTWTITNGHLIASTTTGNVFSDTTTTHDYGLAVDSGTLCPPEVQMVSIPAQPSVTDPCGNNNATWNVPADTTELTWSLSNAGVLTVQTNPGYMFSDTTTSHSFGMATDSGDACIKKVFVCKYVGTPGVDERLQTGQNPISVSVNAIAEDPVVIGSFFNDAQGRSLVLAFDEGQAEPSAEDCVTPHNQPTVVATPSACVLPAILPDGSVTITVTNPNTYEVTYTVTLGLASHDLTLAAGAHGDVTFSSLAPGNYTAHVTGDDDTAGSASATIAACPVGGSGGGGQVLGASTTTPTLADTGASVLMPTILAISMTLTAAGVMLGNYMQRKSAASDPTL